LGYLQVVHLVSTAVTVGLTNERNSNKINVRLNLLKGDRSQILDEAYTFISEPVC
jgi:hypothetical protein